MKSLLKLLKHDRTIKSHILRYIVHNKVAQIYRYVYKKMR